MVKFQILWSLLLLGLLLFTTTTQAESEENLNDFNNNKAKNDQHSPSEKISTSLIVKDNIKNNQTLVPKVKVSVSSSSSSSSSSLSLLSSHKVNNNTHGNAMKKQTIDLKTNQDSENEKDTNESDESPEALPEAMSLRGLRPGSRRRPFYRPPPPRKVPLNSNRRNVYPVEAPLRSKRPIRKPIDNKREPTEQECTFFGKTVCLKTLNYPQEAILRSIRGNRDMMVHLLKDYNNQKDDKNDNFEADVFPLENRDDNRYDNNEIKRKSDYTLPYDNTEEGFTCPSQVMYARPQLARAASGIWKYIINTGEHTQTLRLEKCLKAKASCSFISDNYRSSCVQVYNYHRLLTWDKDIGLHIDIFKIPSCCSCHVHGYTELFPPIQKDPPSLSGESFPGYDFTSNKDERPSSYLTKYKPSLNFNSNQVLTGNSKPIIDASSSNHPSFLLPTRSRQKKPQVSTAIPRPFDKIPHQHAPNTRAPGYKGPIIKGMKRPHRPNRPFRRDSNQEDDDEMTNSNRNKWLDQSYDSGSDTSTQVHSENYDDEDYPEGNRRINYNYHPIIEFFEPKASMLQAEPHSTKASFIDLNGNTNAWKPMIKT